MTALTPDMPIAQHISLIEAALEKALNRGPEMSVEPGNNPGTLYVWVLNAPYEDTRTGHSLHEIARDLERLLA